jgi:hypothetical protein
MPIGRAVADARMQQRADTLAATLVFSTFAGQYVRNLPRMRG